MPNESRRGQKEIISSVEVEEAQAMKWSLKLARQEYQGNNIGGRGHN